MGKSSNFKSALKSFQEIGKLEEENGNLILLIVPWLSHRGARGDGKNGARKERGECDVRS